MNVTCAAGCWHPSLAARWAADVAGLKASGYDVKVWRALRDAGLIHATPNAGTKDADLMIASKLAA